jgi:tetratricopeptide (TPR) repeat protein
MPYTGDSYILEEDLDFEIPFYEDIVRDSPDLASALIALGDAYTKKGLYEKGLGVDLRLSQLRPKDATVHYNLACDYSLLKRTDEAVATLEKAIRLGYRAFDYMSKDPDLGHIRNDARYNALVAKYKKKRKGPSGR